MLRSNHAPLAGAVVAMKARRLSGAVVAMKARRLSTAASQLLTNSGELC
jgi:hypothetical protein